MDIRINEAYAPYWDDSTRTQIFYGGSSSGKSFFIAQRVIKDVLCGRNYLIVRNVGRTIRYSVYNQIIKAILDYGLQGMFTISKTDMVITCGRNNKQILFAGLDDVEKLKSITPIDGVLTDIWIEEATETSYEAYKQLSKRLRGITEGDTPKRIIFSFNPIVKEHWIYREFFGKWDDSKVEYREDGLVIRKTTYKDNAFLTGDDIKALENEKDRYYYEVYTLGNWGVLGKVIFKNWRMEDLTDRIPSFANIYNGLDFGFSDDPTAIIRCCVDQARKIIYVFDEFYKCEVYNDELADVCIQMFGNQYVTCDSAQPGDIGELNRRGVRAIGAKKGAGSILTGITFLKDYEIVIDPRCQNFKNEIQAYQWKEDKYGNALRQPVDKDNHLIDALRYATEGLQTGSKAVSARRI